MNWNVKEDFCADGTSHSSMYGTTYLFWPKLLIETKDELTANEKRRVIDALVKAASVEMIHINEENNK